MCELSNEIKLCSCTDKNYEALENAWIIFRRKKDWFTIGQTVFNAKELKIQEIEIQTIERNLNSKKMFDFDYLPEEEDRLKIKLTYKNKCSEYDFKYVNTTWIFFEEPLDWMEEFIANKPQYTEEFSGKIEKPFKRIL